MAKRKDQATDQAKGFGAKGLVFGSEEARSLTSNQSSLSLNFKENVQVFVLANAMFFPERVHFAKLDGNNHRAVCGIHALGDIGATVSGRGEDHCPQCAHVQKVWGAWRDAKSNGDKLWQDELKKVASDYGSTLTYYFIGATMQYELRKATGKTNVVPFLAKGEKLKWSLLSFTEATFKKFQAVYEEAKLDSQDLIGCPLVFHIGQSQEGSTYRSVQDIEILHKKRIDVPVKLPVNFDKLGLVDQSALETMANGFSEELELILSGEKKNSKIPAKKKVAKKKSKR